MGHGRAPDRPIARITGMSPTVRARRSHSRPGGDAPKRTTVAACSTRACESNAAQIGSGTATGYSSETVNKGDRVKVRGYWYPVVRVNAKSVSIQTPYSWTDTVPYAELQDLRRPE